MVNAWPRLCQEKVVGKLAKWVAQNRRTMKPANGQRWGLMAFERVESSNEQKLKSCASKQNRLALLNRAAHLVWLADSVWAYVFIVLAISHRRRSLRTANSATTHAASAISCFEKS